MSQKSSSKMRLLWPIYIVIFLDIMGFTLLIPIYPKITQYMATQSGFNLEYDAIFAGILMTSYSLFQFLFSPILGRLSDLYGRKKLLILSIAGNVFSYFLWVISQSYEVFLISRVISGATGGNISVAQSYIADVTSKKERAKYMGIMGAIFGIGFIVGPFLGGVLASLNMSDLNLGMLEFNPYSLVGTVAMLLSLFNLIAAKRVLTENNQGLTRNESWLNRKIIHPKSKTTLKHRADENQSHRLGEMRVGTKINKFAMLQAVRSITNPDLLIIFGAYFIMSLGFVHIEAILSWDMDKRFHLSDRETGYFFAYMGIIMALVQGGIYRFLVININLKTLALAGTLILALGLILMPSSNLLAIAAFTTAIMAFGWGICNPSIQTLTSIKANENEQGISLGIMQSAGSLARIIAPITATLSFNQGGYAYPYYIAAILLLISFGLLWKIKPEY